MSTASARSAGVERRRSPRPGAKDRRKKSRGAKPKGPTRQLKRSQSRRAVDRMMLETLQMQVETLKMQIEAQSQHLRLTKAANERLRRKVDGALLAVKTAR